MRVLLLGGTTEANHLAQSLAQQEIPALYSYAGRTSDPVAPPLPHRIGGFGGTDGLIAFLRTEGITHVVDATHPFAAQMSINAVAACTHTALPLLRLERAPWTAQNGDNWTSFPTLDAVVAALPTPDARIFLAIGKQQIGLFAQRPEHHYLLRLVDAPDAPLPLSRSSVEVAKGPFDVPGDVALLRRHAVTLVGSKNCGGAGAEAKLTAARALGVPVLMVERPPLPATKTAETVPDVMTWLRHNADLGV